MERRRFLRFVAAAATTPLWLQGAGCAKKSPKRQATLIKAGLAASRRCRVKPRDKGPGRVLDAKQWATLDAACERIYPSDAKAAGARDAKVITFIDAQLTQPPVKAFTPLLKLGAMQLERLARREGKPYAQLSAPRQEAILQRVQRSRLGRYSGGRFVRILLALTLEGMFSDPIYGGNRGGVGWKSIGFAPQLPAPRCPWGGVADDRGEDPGRGA
jgi:gluconate 2-dehydrogenase gamma chain